MSLSDIASICVQFVFECFLEECLFTAIHETAGA